MFLEERPTHQLLDDLSRHFEGDNGQLKRAASTSCVAFKAAINYEGVVREKKFSERKVDLGISSRGLVRISTIIAFFVEKDERKLVSAY